MDKKIEVLATREEIVRRSPEIILSKMEAAIQSRNRFTIALAGGGTPKPVYEALAKQDLPLDQIHIFWGDERYVPPDHPDSNQKMARSAWLDRVNFPESNIHPMPTGSGNPQVDAEKHDRQIREFFGVAPGEFPSFDMILLGMGDDAHTASLFPFTDALQVCDRLVTVGNKDGEPRITFTIPLINQADCVVFLVAGASKRSALAEVFAPTGDANAYPSRFIQPQGELWWLLDAAAGEEIQKS
ncbi:6-phosphogluconolactonase [Limnospira fusiformis KN01]|uniref:6-phosphogluconolactonase n=1 Tax=Limnospira TaxID=2596745 RepID=UPI001658B27D|nr:MULTISPECIES: 6-phosphogluconolactonase [Limnospira]MDT9197514.1 6-phosphogluconolactonase [Limnospira sp. PMC 1042.18]ULB48199.1 6-phosphogluconolactonase [Limnospira fusiformis KN01]